MIIKQQLVHCRVFRDMELDVVELLETDCYNTNVVDCHHIMDDIQSASFSRDYAPGSSDIEAALPRAPTG